MTLWTPRHATALGVGGVLVLPPFYYKVTDNGVAQYFDNFIEQTKQPNLRIYLYHFPKMTGVPFSIPLIQYLVKTYPKYVVGIKDSSGDLDNMQQMIEAIPNFQVFAGTERYLLDMLESGGAGCISATANTTIPLASLVTGSSII